MPAMVCSMRGQYSCAFSKRLLLWQQNAATPEEKARAAKVLQGLRSPDSDKVAAGREKIAQMKANKVSGSACGGLLVEAAKRVRKPKEAFLIYT